MAVERQLADVERVHVARRSTTSLKLAEIARSALRDADRHPGRPEVQGRWLEVAARAVGMAREDRVAERLTPRQARANLKSSIAPHADVLGRVLVELALRGVKESTRLKAADLCIRALSPAELPRASPDGYRRP